MKIDISEFRQNLDLYLYKAAHEDIDVYEGDLFRVRLSFPVEKKMELIDQLTGIFQLDEDIDIETIVAEHYKEKYGI